MRRRIRILISSAGRRVELIRCFRQDATALDLDVEVFAVDANPELSPACRVADQCFKVPRCIDPDFIPCLLEICNKKNVNLIVPTIDTELEYLALNLDEFQVAGVEVALSRLAVVRMARNKLETARFLSEHGIETPRTARVSEFLDSADEWTWPVILKPIDGSSSAGLVMVNTPQEARMVAPTHDGHIVQEFWKGREYTVNIFFDKDGQLRCAVPHLRLEIRSGEVSKGITEREEQLLSVATRLGRTLVGARGALCFQAIVDTAGRAAVFEINARFGGGFPLTHKAGGQFSRWLLEEVAGLPCSARDVWKEDVIMLRYDSAIFFERTGAS